MLNKIQVQLLKKGSHDNTSLTKQFKTGARSVVLEGTGLMGEKTQEVVTPNRRQRRKMAKLKK